MKFKIKLLLSIFTYSLLSIYSNSIAECLEDWQKNGCIRPQLLCRQERLDKRCNNDSDCCPGKQCNSFGMCEVCRD